MPKENTQFQGYGVGIPRTIAPIPVKYPPEVDAILRSLPNRSEKIRQWVLEGMRREGLLEDE